MRNITNDWADGLRDLLEIETYLENHFCFELEMIDKSANRISAMLDQIAGIDALAVKDNRVLGIALRIQDGKWDTFTVRYKRHTGLPSEYQKYDPAQQKLASTITMQIYRYGHTLRIGYAWTAALMDYAHQNEAAIEKRTAPDGNQFLVIHWSDLEAQPWFKRCEIPYVPVSEVATS